MEKVLNKQQTATDVYTVLDAVICPNLCFNGMVKIYEYERALYDLVKCPYCKGKGKVTKNEASRIDALL
jgi:hypothetical protein